MQAVLNRSIQPQTLDIEKVTIAQVRKFDLDNGIPVYALTAGFQDLVKIEFLFFNTGFDRNNPLLNSATNRMLSEGTTRHSSQELADKIDYYGAFLETEENADYTSIVLYTLNKYLPDTLPFINEILKEAIFPKEELETYKRNNKQRLMVENEKVSSVARRQFNNVIFGDNHPYGHYVQIGDYDKLEPAALKKYFQEKYKTGNCTIIISGMVKDESIKLLNKYFGQDIYANGITGYFKKPYTSSESKRHFIEKDNAVQTAIRIGKTFFNRTHADYPGMAFVNTLLGGYFGSRLMSNIREDKGFTYGIGSAIVSMKQDGYFFISTEVGAEVTNAAIDEIYKEIEMLKSEPVEKDELEMARNYMLGTFLKGMDGAFQLAERFKSIFLSGLDYSYYDYYLDKLRTIQPDEIRELSRKYFDKAGFYEVIVGRK